MGEEGNGRDGGGGRRELGEAEQTFQPLRFQAPFFDFSGSGLYCLTLRKLEIWRGALEFQDIVSCVA